MKNKYLYSICCFFGFLIIILAITGVYQNYYKGKNVRGNYTFINTRKNIERLARIKMVTAQDGEINIVKEDDVWKFREANNYFANVEMISEFYKMVNNSIILEVNSEAVGKYGLQLNKDGRPEQGIAITTYDEHGKVLDDLVMSSFADADFYRMIKKVDSPYIYMVNEALKFSGNAENWLPYPLLNITQDMVETLIWNEEVYNRHYFEKLLQHSAKGREVMQILQYVGYQGLTTVDDFVSAYPQARTKNIKVITTVGLIYDMYLYHVEDTYWMRIKLESTKIPRKTVPSFIRDNQKYFANWVFQLDEEQGKVLYRTKLPTVMKK